MVASLNPNPSLPGGDLTIQSPRNAGRGSCKIPSTGATSTVSWVSGFIRIDGVNFIPMATAPQVLDLSYDIADRPILCWITGGNGFIRFYNPLIVDYDVLAIGACTNICCCYDYELFGTNTVVAYLLGTKVNYRLQSDRFATNYLLSNQDFSEIQKFGVVSSLNSIAVVGE